MGLFLTRLFWHFKVTHIRGLNSMESQSFYLSFILKFETKAPSVPL